MANTKEIPDFVFTSKTQSPEQIQKALEERGYTEFQIERLTDTPDPEEPEASEEPEEPEAPEAPEEPAPAAPEPPKKPEPPKAPDKPAEPPKPGDTPPRPKESGSAKAKRQRDEARERVKDLERQLEEAKKAPVAQPAAAPPPPAPKPEPPVEPEPVFSKTKPKFEDFEKSDDQLSDFNEALTDWKLDKRDFEKAKEEKVRKKQEDAVRAVETQRTESQRQSAEDANRKVIEWRDEALKKYPDFEEIALNPKVKINDAMSTVVMHTERSHDLAMWLGQNPAEARKIFDETTFPKGATDDQKQRLVLKAARLLGRIEAGLPPADEPEPEDDDLEPEETTEEPEAITEPPPPEPPKPAPPAPPKAPASQLPPKKPTPPTPVGNRGGGSGPKRISQMSADELRKLPPDEYRKMLDKGLF